MRTKRRARGRPGRTGLAPVFLCVLLSYLPATGNAASLATHLADLPPAEQAALEASAEEQPFPQEPRELLEQIFLLDTPYRFDAGLMLVDTDRRWFATVPPDSPGVPMLEVRRWPGDTVLALYVLQGSKPPDSGYLPPLPEATLEGPTLSEKTWRWQGTLQTALGSRSVLWMERSVPGAATRLGALLVPGDAGLGPEAIPDLTLELLMAFGRVETRSEAWVDLQEQVVTGPVLLPELGMVPKGWDEREDAWQIARGLDFTLGVPPGVRARWLISDFPGPRPVPGGLLWLRGRFTNSDGEPVVLGDASHSGYVAEVRPAGADWQAGNTPPLGAPGATRVAGAPFELATQRTRAVAARAERWREPSLEGDWLVFRLVLQERGIEIGLPVLSGRRSEALFWIPLTWREIDQSPAFPPIDPAKRFGVRFEQLGPSARKRNPWIEGYLTVPGLRLELPVGWWPVARLRSEDGFPIRFVDQSGREVARLDRLKQGSPELEMAGTGEWTAMKRPGRFHAAAVYDAHDGARLYIAREGHAFLLRNDPETLTEPVHWHRLVESAFLLRPKPTP